MHTKKLIALGAVLMVPTGAALAASDSGTITGKLTPNKAGKASTLSVTAKGPFSGTSGIPTGVKLVAPKGFGVSTKSVAALCTAAQEKAASCPAASQIGGGTADLTASLGATTVPDTVTFTLYLGVPAKGDVASFFIAGKEKLLGQTASSTGRLVKVNGVYEILIPNLPKFTPPAGASVTVNSLTLSGGAKRTVKVKGKSVTYSLITNPAKCTKAGWTATDTITYQSGSVTKAVTFACS